MQLVVHVAPTRDEETLLMLDLENEQPVMCESHYHNVDLGMPTHPAHWYAMSVCGSMLAVCENRRHHCYISDGWRCDPDGCRGFHPYSEITFTPLK